MTIFNLVLLIVFMGSSSLCKENVVQFIPLSGNESWITYRDTDFDSKKSGEPGWNATVPGSMYMDLLANKVISDPYKRYNDISYAIYALSTWLYSREIKVASSFLSHTYIDLVCDGIDTSSKVYMNGNHAGTTDNQFMKYRFPVKSFLVQGGNTLNFEFESPVTYAAYASKFYPYSVPPECPPDVQHGQCHPNFIRKEQASFSWDWGPSFPTMGIWKDIRLEGYDGPVLEDFSAEVYEKDDNWIVNITAYLQGVHSNAVPGEYLFTAVLWDTGINKTAKIVSISSDVLSTTLEVPQKLVKRWWPNGLGGTGGRPLYNLSVSLSQSSPHWISKRIGFRTVELVQEPIKGAKGLSFYFRVNGMPLFMKGSNWIPADSFQSRVTKDKLRDLLGSAQKANMNMLRVWGGGIYEQDDFYDIADELGILIWQDLMFACAMYPTNLGFLSNVEGEVIHQVRRLKHHASIALWAGNNENEAALRGNWYKTDDNFTLYKNDYVKLYIDALKTVVNSEHSSGIYVSSSPSNGIQSEKEGWVAQNPYDPKYGDVHFYNYAAGNEKYPRTRFMSEYGYQSWPSFSLLKPLTISEDWHEFSNFSLYRNHHGSGQDQMNAQIRYQFNEPNATEMYPGANYSNYIYLTQINQALYIKSVSEFCRRSQSYLYGDEGMTMGALYWQLNDIWPGPSWSSIEYGGKWKMLHYYARDFFRSKALYTAIENGNLTVYLISDEINMKADSGNLTITCQPWSTFQYTSQHRHHYIKTTAQVSDRVLNMNLTEILTNLKCEDRSKHFLYATWYDKSASRTDSVSSVPMSLSTYKDTVGLKKAHISISITGKFPKFSLNLKSDRPAAFVWIETAVRRVTILNNGFLMYEPVYSVDVMSSTVSQLKTSDFTVKSLMDLYD